MTCPKCEERVKTRETRERNEGISRVRFCSCGWKAVTREIPATRYKELLDIERRYIEILDGINEQILGKKK